MLPGTNIIMPELNGHEIELEAVSALAAPGPPATDDPPAQPSNEEP